jgi:zinc protease
MTFANISSLAFLLALGTGCAVMSVRGPTADPLAAPSVVSGTLPNGFSYYVLRNADPSNELSLRLLVKAGAAEEDDDQRGAAHFVEHLALDGTKHFRRSDIDGLVRNWGLSTGAHANADSRPDSSQYQLIVPTSAACGGSKAFAFLRDVAGNISFDAGKIEVNRPRLVAEWQSGIDVDHRVEQARAAMLFAGSRVADRLSPASPADLARATPDGLRRFYRHWYRPDTMALVAVGPLDPKSLVRNIERTFGDLEVPAQERPVTLSEVPFNNELLVKVVTDPDLAETKVEFSSRFEAAKSGKVRLRTANLQGLVTGLMAVRLYYGTENPTLLGAQTSFPRTARGVELVRLTGVVLDGGIERAVRALFAERARVSRYGFSQQELSAVMQQLPGRYEEHFRADALLPSEGIADSLGDLFLMRIPYQDRTQLRAWGPELLSTVTLEDVNAWARDHGGPRGTMLFISGPMGAAVPTEAELRAWAREASLEPPNVPSEQTQTPFRPSSARGGT